METYSFSGKHVLITGASGGLGSALSARLAAMGAGLVVSSRSMKALEELISMLPEGTRVEAVTADLSTAGQAEELAHNAVEAIGHIDVLINNAGLGYFALMEEATDQNIRHLFEVNTFAPIALIKALVPHMKKRGGGRIVNIVSAAGRVPIPTVGVYGGSKSALAVMANTMRLELAPAGIDVINVYPGTIDSSFEENALREEKRPGLCPTDRCGLPKNRIADQVLRAATGRPGEVWLEREGKWLSTAALILPRFVDRWLAPIRDKVVKTKSVKKRRWNLLQVESAFACNLRCVMCPWQEIRKQAEHGGIMREEVWEAIRPHLPQVRSIDFTGGGEPLLQPRLARWVAQAKSAGCETGILTNGLLLNKPIAQKLLDAGLDWICVSMDGATAKQYEAIREGSDFERVCGNLAALADMRRGKIPKTMINYVLMLSNFHEVEEMVRLAVKLRVDQLNFKQCDVIRGEHGKGHGLFDIKETKETRRLKKELSRAVGLARKLGLETTTSSFTPMERSVCDQDPRTSLFIRYNGQVGPCINLAVGGSTTFLGKDVTMPVIHYGRLSDADLLELWESDECRFYRGRFEQRVKTYEDTFVGSFVAGAGSSRERIQQSAVKAMPEAPEGCKVCHYLYDI